MAETDTQEKQPSILGAAARGAVGMAIVAAIGGAIVGAAGLAGINLMGAGGFVNGALNLVGMGTEVAAGAAAAVEITGGTAALGGAALGAISGAVLGAPAGAIAGPMRLKQQQTEAAIPEIAQQAMQQGFAMGQQHQHQAEQQIGEQSSKYRDMVAQSREGVADKVLGA